ncbi:MAG: hypothetical protein WD801_11375 [Gemmatimonadaceae bacterium]
MGGTYTTALGVLLLSPDSALRKTLRRHLDGDGHAVLAVGSIGEAVARLRSRHYALVLCTNFNNTESLADDYGLLVDSRGLLARNGSYELYLPGVGIDARAVLMVPGRDPLRVVGVVRQVAERLGFSRRSEARSSSGAGQSDRSTP